ncbi:palmdelphin [Myripristis murdjan]|uniref:palmdelphin n=1 Tax=Myripristis murdjan TaxID=586833 RepID=UPI0011762BA9|nr:palmdelphin-like [Myripristis murdjan]XP_029929799.1 palmdelphin-like [Myripristis murdjan]
MDESDLLKERLQAITEKSRVQEDIRQKKLELDREKLKLQHLKKKSLREQWLLGDSASHNAVQRQQSILTDQQRTSALQVNIQRIEKEVESLEREETLISANEGFILKKLKAVEKSTEEIIKEVQDNFIPDPVPVATVIPALPESFSSLAQTDGEANTLRHTLFAMEVNVAKNLLTGESLVVSTAEVSPQELKQHSGVKVFDDGQKCVYALEAQQGSHDHSCVSELSANEVEQLLRDATQYCHRNQQNHSRRQGRRYSNHLDERQKGEGHQHRNQGEKHYYGNHHPRNSVGQEGCCYSNQQSKNLLRRQSEEHYYGDRVSHRSQKERCCHSNQREGHYLRNQQEDHHCTERNCHGNHSYHNSNRASSIIRSSSKMSGGRTNGCPPPRSHDQKTVSAYQSELCYTPANHIPLSDYVSVDEDVYLYRPAPYRAFDQSENSHNGNNRSSALYYGPSQSDRPPSPLFEADAPYTILSTIDATEPITAIFMGFQTSQDDSGRGQEYDGSLKAELVIIDDNDDGDNDNKVKEGNGNLGAIQEKAGRSANGKTGAAEAGGHRWSDRWLQPGIRKIQKKHKPCCTVC